VVHIENESDGSVGVIGQNLARLMRKHQIRSQRELARLVGPGISQADISRILSGETKDPGASKLKIIADKLGESMDEFWRENQAPAGAEHPSFQAFIDDHELSAGVTDEEIDLLRKEVLWPWGQPTKLGWYHALQRMRATRNKPSSG
jgi:transcriptional regulator with XRE-family HTH domain